MKNYSKELNVQYLIALLKKHNISKIIASPGTTNLSFVASLQSDPFFEMYSCVDERSAGYMAIGISQECNEPVVITCTGATASRNYMSALTEAYYRKIPILAITGSQRLDHVGQLKAQVIDRSSVPNDICLKSINVLPINNSLDAYYCQLHINDALLELSRRGGGPVHINLVTIYNRDFSITKLPEVKKIIRYDYSNVDNFPDLPKGKIGIFVGSHNLFSNELAKAVDRFCSTNDAVVFCDHTSGYYGNYKVNYSLIGVQEYLSTDLSKLALCIHIGEVSGDYGTIESLRMDEVWRVSQDGELKDPFKKLTNVFEVTETDFFNFYSKENTPSNSVYLTACRKVYDEISSNLGDLPFSNVWIASVLSYKIPENSVIHFGILNSLRTWSLFNFSSSIRTFANVGGFGIDGCMSSLIGASLTNPNKLYFGVFGDLAFFYDINSLGNRHIGDNVRILLVNNGKGTEFRNFYHTGSLFGEDADEYIAAARHFGNKSRILVKNYVENLGFEYLKAENKQEFESVCEFFLSPQICKSIIFEVFTNSADESNALKMMWHISKNGSGIIKSKLDAIVKTADKCGVLPMLQTIIGSKGIKFVKRLLNK